MASEDHRRGSLPKLLVFCLVPAVAAGVAGAAGVGGSKAVVFGVVFGVILGLLAAAFGVFIARHTKVARLGQCSGMTPEGTAEFAA